MATIEITPEISRAIDAGAVVAIGVSGGKDSSAATAAVMRFLDDRGHPKDQRLLIHSDLGEIEWRQSHEICSKLADMFSVQFVTLRGGGLLERWESRWESMAGSYRDLRRVTLTMPWSSAALRFCTSETKQQRISAFLKKRFPGRVIISVCGIRRQESPKRALAPIAKANLRLKSARAGTSGYDWNPILGFTLDDVWELHRAHGLPIHEAYSVYGSSRVSCSFCILQSLPDQRASITNPQHRTAWRRIAALEVASGFAFQKGRWLADLGVKSGFAEDWENFAVELEAAKRIAAERETVEARLPERLLFVKGWPTFVPELADCELLAEVRTKVCSLYGWSAAYLDGPAVRDRYVELFAARPGQQSLGAA